MEKDRPLVLSSIIHLSSGGGFHGYLTKTKTGRAGPKPIPGDQSGISAAREPRCRNDPPSTPFAHGPSSPLICGYIASAIRGHRFSKGFSPGGGAIFSRVNVRP